MNTIRVNEFAVLLRLHRRGKYLQTICSQIKYLARRRKCHLVVMLDRPNTEVVSLVGNMENTLPDNIRMTILEAPEPTRSSRGTRWMENLMYMHSHAKDSDAGILWDDDLFFSDQALEEMAMHMEFFEFDRVDCLWLHAADSAAQTANEAFPDHIAACLFRIYEEDNWSDILTKTVIGGGSHCPLYVARSQRATFLKGKAIHMGYATYEERERAWLDAKAAGQIDGHYRSLIKEPVIRPLRGRDETSDSFVTERIQNLWLSKEETPSRSMSSKQTSRKRKNSSKRKSQNSSNQSAQ